MKKNHTLFLGLFLFALPLFGIGCLNISTNPVKDGGVFRSVDFGETWEQKVFVRQEKKKVITIAKVNPLSITFHPKESSTIFLGTESNGIFVSADGGETWSATSIGNGNARALAIDPEVPTTIYLALGSTILKTIDNMATWETIYVEPRAISITDVRIDLSNVTRIYAATAAGDLLVSEDFGERWDTIQTFGDAILEIHMDPVDSKIFYLRMATTGLQKTTDRGSSFVNIQNQFAAFPGALAINDLYIVPTHPDALFIATNYGILHSTDGGATWSAIQTLFPLGSIPIPTVRADPRDESIIYFPVKNILHKTTDGGATWKTIETLPTSRNVYRLVFHPDDSSILYLAVHISNK